MSAKTLDPDWSEAFGDDVQSVRIVNTETGERREVQLTRDWPIRYDEVTRSLVIQAAIDTSQSARTTCTRCSIEIEELCDSCRSGAGTDCVHCGTWCTWENITHGVCGDCRRGQAAESRQQYEEVLTMLRDLRTQMASLRSLQGDLKVMQGTAAGKNDVAEIVAQLASLARSSAQVWPVLSAIMKGVRWLEKQSKQFPSRIWTPADLPGGKLAQLMEDIWPESKR